MHTLQSSNQNQETVLIRHQTYEVEEYNNILEGKDAMNSSFKQQSASHSKSILDQADEYKD